MFQCRSLIKEQPSSGRRWMVPALINLIKIAAGRRTNTVFCAFGTPWKKSTGLAYGGQALALPFLCACALLLSALIRVNDIKCWLERLPLNMEYRGEGLPGITNKVLLALLGHKNRRFLTGEEKAVCTCLSLNFLPTIVELV